MHPKSLLICALSGALVLPAQQAPAPGQAAAGGLEITVVAGEGAQNSIPARTAVAPVVEVKEGGKPVAGAEVVFQLPPVGPSGNFNGWLKTQTVRTDDQGKTTVAGYKPNTEAGQFNIKVTAASGTKTGMAVISQTNVDGPGTSGGTATAKKSNWWKWAIVAGVAGGIIAGVAVASGDDSTTTTAKVPITITSGAVTVGGPR